ncbi:hypothetical protein DH2020_000854 [Rehmannia glutinosa]|uniref:DYW domain-containing protein n=1 Tax=Rehmannia glutinosa TaxID=99300 RepID=A0ABR0XXP2_REHGL
MATVLVTAPPPELSTVTHQHHHHRVFNILTQSTTVSIPHLKQIHAQILRTGPAIHHSPETVFLYSRLMHFSSLRDLIYTLQLFNQIPFPNTFIYNTLIRAHAHSKDHKKQAFLLFQELLKQESLLPDKHTFPFVLKACAYLFALSEGKQTHAHVLKHGFGSDVYVNNSLIHFYASCGHSESARKMFDKMPERSLVSWNVIIDALVQMGEFDEALRMFVEMKPSFEPDGYTVQSVIDACAGLGALSLELFDRDVLQMWVVENCSTGFSGNEQTGCEFVERYDIRISSAWRGREGIQTFRSNDQRRKIPPNSITFVGILSACNHRGLVEEGRRYFDIMVNEYKIEPVLQHYGCLIDLMARNGQINEALDIVSRMPMKPDDVIWRSLLDASCRQSEFLDLSEKMARQIMAGEGRASSGDTTHPQTKEIYQFLDVIEERLKLAGFVQDFSQAPLVDEADDGKGQSLKLHSERLAIAFGLLNSKPGAPIRVFKNLRICKDCHNFTKFISKVFSVEIVMRDRLRFHCFRNGSCSCMDFW